MKYKIIGSIILSFTIVLMPSNSFANDLLLGKYQDAIKSQTTIPQEVKPNIQFNKLEVINIVNGFGESYDFDTSRVFKFISDINSQESLLQMDEIIFEQELSKIKSTLNEKEKNSYIIINTKGELVEITKEVQALEMDIFKLKQDLIFKVKAQDFTPYHPIFNYGQLPYRTIEDMKKINFILTEFSTTFDSKVKGRTENIALAANSIDKTILMPGEEFSFNKIVGRTTIARGYKNAPVIVDGEFVEGVGGGVCQVSTTLFNAVLRSGLLITHRKNHSLPVAYVPKGTDAAIASNLDFKFKNTLNNPIYIQAFVEKSRIYFRIYGSQSDSKDVKITVKKVGERKYEMTRTVNGSIQDIFVSNYRKPKKTK